eukprot:TRINITY_DN83687_c0_g1_i1.p1 TRINITY_DN83687_c0_g1~~TRINITY_DN83687_c0_g1_i1.p1  ORF type:complete len:230 (-),score=33.17 TRINITY_DN83687_c0_g1_i1:250-915(-)
MVIDFPEAKEYNPTQCIALAVDGHYINDTIHYLNNYYNSNDEKNIWKLQFNQYHFQNDTDVTALINKIISVCSGTDIAKNIYADLSLKELLIRLLQSQRLQQYAFESETNSNESRLHYVLNYIKDNLSEKIAVETLSKKVYLSRNVFFKWFKEQFGLSPVEYINNERIKLSKKLLAETNNNLQSVSDICGFSDVNYFTRVFKQLEGITPKAYQSILHKKST